MRFMKEGHDASSLNQTHISTALEYQQANEGDNRAGRQIDQGNEPYLINLDAMEAGLHPYVVVEDVAAELEEDGDVMLYTPSRSYAVSPDTILMWR